MSFQWWVLIHLLGVVAFAAAHGVSMSAAFRLRNERDPARINALLDTSARSVTPFYISFAVLLAGGIGAAFAGGLWGFGWIWAAIVTLVVVIAAMYAMAKPYYDRVRVIAKAMEEGTEAVTAEQFDGVLRSGRPLAIIGIGVAGLVFILYLMILKPTFGLEPAGDAGPVAGARVEVAAQDILFDTATLSAPAGEPFTIVFDNRDSGVPHNVAIYTDQSAAEPVFIGEIFPGPSVRNYAVEPIEAGSYFFVCDVHPTTMTGSIEVG